jgi:hypothetical protein
MIRALWNTLATAGAVGTASYFAHSTWLSVLIGLFFFSGTFVAFYYIPQFRFQFHVSKKEVRA